MKVAIIGHRTVQDKAEVAGRIYDALTDLVENDGADTFLFGGQGEFDRLCFMVVTEMQKIYSQIKTVYVRAQYEHIQQFYEEYLLEYYDETYYPDKVSGSNELCYVVRNFCMIESCDVLLTYCDSNYLPPSKTTKNKMMAAIYAHKTPNSGTHMAVRYAKKRNKRIINLFENSKDN